MLTYFFMCAVYADGSICLDILQNQWSPIYDVAAILTSIQVICFFCFFAAQVICLPIFVTCYNII